MQNTNPMNNLFDQDNDNTDTMSDEFDSDSKENESVSLAKIYLGKCFCFVSLQK
jgi:hypothetical protein